MMKERTAAIAFVILAGLLSWLWMSTETPIQTEEQARAGCKTALDSHLRDLESNNIRWELKTVIRQSDPPRWLCTYQASGDSLYIILKPSGGFEVSTTTH